MATTATPTTISTPMPITSHHQPRMLAILLMAQIGARALPWPGEAG